MRLKPCLPVLLAAGLFACSKQETSIPQDRLASDSKAEIPADKDQLPTQLSGTWKGQYGFYGTPAPGDTVFYEPGHVYTMIFQENGEMTVYDGNEDAILKAEGQYAIRGRELTAQYHYIRGGSGTFSLKATLTGPGQVDGKWFIGGPGGPTGGKFYLRKQFWQ